MIDKIIAVKDIPYVCLYVGDCKWKCGKCTKGVFYVFPKDHQGYKNPNPRKCRVCAARFIIQEILR